MVALVQRVLDQSCINNSVRFSLIFASFSCTSTLGVE
jgi:hypothetical protein